MRIITYLKQNMNRAWRSLLIYQSLPKAQDLDPVGVNTNRSRCRSLFPSSSLAYYTPVSGLLRLPFCGLRASRHSRVLDFFSLLEWQARARRRPM